MSNLKSCKGKGRSTNMYSIVKGRSMNNMYSSSVIARDGELYVATCNRGTCRGVVTYGAF